MSSTSVNVIPQIQTPVTPLHYLSDFLRRRNLPKPDGRMLYAYRLDQEEFENLRGLLRIWLSDEVLQGGGHLAAGVAESFVLYGASWWQREYAGGAWRWDDVIDSFGGTGSDWPLQFRTQCVQAGLRFWEQRVGTAGKRFFGVLVEQGGLPRVLLAKSQGNISALIRALLKRAARLGAEVDEIAVMAADYKEKLPIPLQKHLVYLLIAQVVGTLLDIKREFKLERGDDTVSKLDRLEPNWRERFPISLDDQAAVGLLRELVGEAAAIEVETRASPVMSERLLRTVDGIWEIVSRVDFPQSIDAVALAQLAGVDENELPFRFPLEINTDKRQLAADIRKILGSTPKRYQFTVLQSIWTGAAALREHVLCFSTSAGAQTNSAVPGGMELDPSSPWIFVESGEERRFVAQGSSRIRSDNAFLVLNDAWQIEISDEESVVEKIGPFGPQAPGKSVFKVSGDIRVLDGTNLFRIRTRQIGADVRAD